MQSLPIDDRLAIANMTTEWSALTGFPIDSVLKGWLRHKAIEGTRLKDRKLLDNTQRFTHHNLERLFDNEIEADIGAKYTKRLYLNLSTLSPYVSGPNSVKIENPLTKLISDQITID
jgi:homoaconitate hydratase